MMFSSLAQVSFLTAPNDSVSGGGRLQRESVAQRDFDSYCQSFSLGDPFPPVFRTSAAWWLEGGKKRRVRFEIDPTIAGGEVKGIEVANRRELDDLTGDGKTLSTFLAAFADVGPVSNKR